MCVIVGSEDAMFHEGTYAHFSERLTQWLAVIALISGKGLQLARV